MSSWSMTLRYVTSSFDLTRKTTFHWKEQARATYDTYCCLHVHVHKFELNCIYMWILTNKQAIHRQTVVALPTYWIAMELTDWKGGFIYSHTRSHLPRANLDRSACQCVIGPSFTYVYRGCFGNVLMKDCLTYQWFWQIYLGLSLLLSMSFYCCLGKLFPVHKLFSINLEIVAVMTSVIICMQLGHVMSSLETSLKRQ